MNDNPRSPRRLYRTTDDKMVAGVCGGLARYLKMDPTLVRVAVALLTLLSLGFGGVIGYIVLIFVMPEQPPTLHENMRRYGNTSDHEERGFDAEPASSASAADPGPPPVFLPEEDSGYSQPQDGEADGTRWRPGSAGLWDNAKGNAGGEAREQDLR